MGRVSWPVVVRLQHIENAGTSDAGAFSQAAMAPFAVPPLASQWLGTFCVNTQEPIVALTYDDGPSPEHTPRILDLLAARGATATFFVLASQVERYPDIARRIVADGHEIALHGIDHRSLLTLTTREAAQQVGRAKQRVEAVVGGPLRLYRPPYGEYTWQQAVRIRLLGLELVIWSGDSRDWAAGPQEQIASRTLSRTFPGGIVLLHDNRGDPETLTPEEAAEIYDRAAVLEEILDRLKGAGYGTRRVSDMLASHQRVRSIARYGSDGIHQNSVTA